MELKHIAPIRLREVASANEQLSIAEAHHLQSCDCCMEIFETFKRELRGSDGDSFDLPWAL